MTYRGQRTRRPSAVGTASYRCLTTPSSRYRPAGGRMEQLRVPPEMFRFTHADRADLYVSMLHAFGEANERLETSLGLDDVRARLRSIGWLDALDDDDLTAALGQLRLWNLIDVIQNHAVDYRTASEYERRNLQYSLTRQGEAALAGVTHAMMMLASTGALQTAVLDAIADRLRDLIHEMEHGSDRRIFTALTELEGHLEALRGNTKQFNGELQRLLRADGTDLATFHDVKAATVAGTPAGPLGRAAGLVPAGRRLSAPGGAAAPGGPPGDHHAVAGSRPDYRVASAHQQRGGRLPGTGPLVQPGRQPGRPAPAVVNHVRTQPRPARLPQPARPRTGRLLDVMAGRAARGGITAAALRRPRRALQPHRPGPRREGDQGGQGRTGPGRTGRARGRVEHARYRRHRPAGGVRPSRSCAVRAAAGTAGPGPGQQPGQLGPAARLDRRRPNRGPAEAPPDGATATLVTPRGTFQAPDYEIQIRACGPVPAQPSLSAQLAGASQ